MYFLKLQYNLELQHHHLSQYNYIDVHSVCHVKCYLICNQLSIGRKASENYCLKLEVNTTALIDVCTLDCRL